MATDEIPMSKPVLEATSSGILFKDQSVVKLRSHIKSDPVHCSATSEVQEASSLGRRKRKSFMCNVCEQVFHSQYGLDGHLPCPGTSKGVAAKLKKSRQKHVEQLMAVKTRNSANDKSEDVSSDLFAGVHVSGANASQRDTKRLSRRRKRGTPSVKSHLACVMPVTNNDDERGKSETFSAFSESNLTDLHNSSEHNTELHSKRRKRSKSPVKSKDDTNSPRGAPDAEDDRLQTTVVVQKAADASLQTKKIQNSKKTLSCESCNVTFATGAKWRRHCVSEHDTPRTITQKEKPLIREKHDCSKCGKSFRSQSHLNVHLLIHSGEKPYKCTLCDKGFSQKGNMKIHMRIHTNEKPYKCSKCDQCFTQKCGLNYHKLIHVEGDGDGIEILDPERAEHGGFYSCRCGMVLASAAAYEVHARTHGGEKPFECKQCGKRFRGKNSFKDHIRRHENDFVATCDYCGKGFYRHKDLMAHIAAKHGTEPRERIQCDECDKSFTAATALNNHKRNIHRQFKGFCCVECGKTFANAYNLRVHMRTHTGEKPYQCNACGLAFCDPSNLIHHKRKVHSKKQPVLKVTNPKKSVVRPRKNKSEAITKVGCNEPHTLIHATDVKRNGAGPEVISKITGSEVSTNQAPSDVTTNRTDIGVITSKADIGVLSNETQLLTNEAASGVIIDPGLSELLSNEALVIDGSEDNSSQISYIIINGDNVITQSDSNYIILHVDG